MEGGRGAAAADAAGVGAKLEPAGTAGAAADGAGAGGGAPGGVHLMSEEQYLQYCERYMGKMGMPFDPDMVRQHYRRMREAAGV